MNLTVAVPTYNRLNCLKAMADSLSRVELIGSPNVNVRIYDDQSTEYSLDQLQELFPFARQILRRDSNLGADGNMRQMYIDFLSTDDDIFFNCDSDFVFNDELLKSLFFIATQLEMDGHDWVFSLYNSSLHEAVEQLTVKNIDLLRKNHVGAAGAVFSRRLIEKIVQLPYSRSFDWDWSFHCTSNGIPIYVAPNSLMQHIGTHGTNSSVTSNFDYGLKFLPSNFDDSKIIINVLEELLISRQNYIGFDIVRLEVKKNIKKLISKFVRKQ